MCDNLNFLKVCDVPVHEKCREFATYGCQGKKTSLESVLNKVTVGSIAPDIPNLKKNDDGSFSSLHELANNGVKVILFFYPKCLLFIFKYSFSC